MLKFFVSVINYMADFFRDRNNGSSYKRLTGFASFIVAVVISFTNQNPTLCGMFLSVSLGEGVATLFERKSKIS